MADEGVDVFVHFTEIPEFDLFVFRARKEKILIER
jgi:cold shock CspA family protein